MIIEALSTTGGWRGTGGIWTDLDGNGSVQSGRISAGDYRSVISFSTAGLSYTESKKLVVSVKVTQDSHPQGCMGVLTQKFLTNSKYVQNDDATGPNETHLMPYAIATSYAYTSEDGMTLSESISKDSFFYLIFDTKDIEPDQTYYVYFIRNIRPDSDGKSWVSTTRYRLSISLTCFTYTACTAPTSFLASPEVFEKLLNIEWSGAEPGVDNPIVSYEVQYAVSSDCAAWDLWQALDNVDGETLTVTPAIDRGLYVKYRIRTIGEAGEEYYSEWVESNAAQKDNNPYVYIGDASGNQERYLTHIYDEQIDPDQPFGKYMPHVFDGTAWQRYS